MYIADSPGHTYFKVHYGWHPISPTQLCDTLDKSNPANCLAGWLTAFEANTKPSAGDFLSWTLTKPFVFAEVTSYNAQSSGPLTDDTLRDFYLPVTGPARQAYTAQTGVPLNSFRQLRDDTLNPGDGVHGVRETFDFGIPGAPTDTFDEVALADTAGDTVYFIVAHCTAACFSQHKQAINDVLTSFTVRSR
jgi:hypothetical protein